MKKGCNALAIIFLVGIILILSVDVISATLCTDSDATTQYPRGANYFAKGSVVTDTGTFADVCEANGKIREYYCTIQNVSTSMLFNCTNLKAGYVCSDGACVNSSTSIPADPCANVNCNDNNACTDDSCSNGNCVNTLKTCSSGQTCSNGACISSCTPNCVSKTCGSNGCGGSCGTCNCFTGTAQCINGTCSCCTPKTCSQLGKNCGSVDNSCGIQINCGSCSSGQTCNNGICVNPCVPNWNCSSWSSCYYGLQTRTCRDLKNCGTNASKSAENQSCFFSIIKIQQNIEAVQEPIIVNRTGRIDNSSLNPTQKNLILALEKLAEEGRILPNIEYRANEAFNGKVVLNSIEDARKYMLNFIANAIFNQSLQRICTNIIRTCPDGNPASILDFNGCKTICPLPKGKYCSTINPYNCYDKKGNIFESSGGLASVNIFGKIIDKILCSLKLKSNCGIPANSGYFEIAEKDKESLRSNSVFGTGFAIALSQEGFDSIDSSKWNQYNPYYPAIIENGKLKATGFQGDISNSNSGITSSGKWFLTGDFDIQVDYDSSLQPASDSAATTAFSIVGGAYSYSLFSSKTNTGAYWTSAWTSQENKLWTISSLSGLASGKWRLERIGDIMNGYQWENNNWVKFASISNCDVSDMYVIMNVYNNIGSTSNNNPQNSSSIF